MAQQEFLLVEFTRPAVEVYPFDSANNVYLMKRYV